MTESLCRSLAIELTPRCNQCCSYCYNAWRGNVESTRGELDAAEILGLVDRVLVDARPRHVVLTGGEPLLREDLAEILEGLRERSLPVAIISNGRLLPRRAELLRAAGVLSLQVTLAGGDATTHDDACGAGAFAELEEGVRAARAVGLQLFGSFLCTRANAARAAGALTRFADWGMRRVAFNRFNPSGYGRGALAALMPTRSELLAALQSASEVAQRRGLDIHVTMPIPPCMLDERPLPAVRFGACSAGSPVGEPAIGCDGRLRLCTVQQHALGDLRTQGFAELMRSEAVAGFRTAIPAFCRDCVHAERCLGGCGAAAEWVYGAAAEVDPFLGQHVLDVAPGDASSAGGGSY